jgi:hypothetical protein
MEWGCGRDALDGFHFSGNPAESGWLTVFAGLPWRLSAGARDGTGTAWAGHFQEF